MKKESRGAAGGDGLSRRNLLLSGTTLAAASALGSVAPQRMAQAQAQPGAAAGARPNILVIFGDDIGLANVSAYSHGLMGYQTPNIDRVAREGMMFIDYYAEQSCTAGRSSFITGQATLRTGLSKVGVPAAPVGLQAVDPTIAELLKPLGYATGQFGKNHLGDRNEYLPTVHGFDEFYGNLYHLNAEEEPENFNYPRDPCFAELFGPRGVLRCKASETDDATEQPRWGRVGKQTIEDTGPLTRKRMETIDDETSDAAVDFIQRQASAGTPFFCWFNSTRMHLRTHVRAEHRDQPGLTARPERELGRAARRHALRPRSQRSLDARRRRQRRRLRPRLGPRLEPPGLPRLPHHAVRSGDHLGTRLPRALAGLPPPRLRVGRDDARPGARRRDPLLSEATMHRPTTPMERVGAKYPVPCSIPDAFYPGGGIQLRLARTGPQRGGRPVNPMAARALAVTAVLTIAACQSGNPLDTSNISSDVVAFIFGESGLMANASIEGNKATEITFEN